MAILFFTEGWRPLWAKYNSMGVLRGHSRPILVWRQDMQSSIDQIDRSNSLHGDVR